MEKTTTRRPASGKTATDALTLLTEDHAHVKKLFREYERIKESGDTEDKLAIATEICTELTVHATAEEEVVYPALREAIEDTELLNEADVEHASAKDLIAQIVESDPDDEMYDAKVKVLGEYIDHHVKEEEGEMFAQARKADIDLVALGAELASRKAELMAEFEADQSAPPRKGGSNAKPKRGGKR